MDNRHAISRWVVAAGVFIVALSVYVSTAAPGLTWKHEGADGGDLLTAAHTWGIPHPTGYPTYLILVRVFSEIIQVGDEAYRGVLFSAFVGAVANTILYLALTRLLFSLPFRVRTAPFLIYVASAIVSLGFALSRVMWSQSTIVEVYALNAVFLAAILLIALNVRAKRIRGESAIGLETLGAFLFGLGLGNHLTLIIAAAPLAVWAIWPIQPGARLALGWRPVAGLLIGVAIYSYAPIASLQGPPINWGHPDSVAGFWWMISGSIYQQYAFGIDMSLIAGRLASWANLFLAQFSVVGVVFGIAGLSYLWDKSRGLAVASVVSVLSVSGYAIGYSTEDSFIYLISAFLIFSAWIVVGIIGFLIEVLPLVSRFGRVGPTIGRLIQMLVLSGVVFAMPIFSFVTNLSELNLRGDWEASEFAQQAFAAAGTGAIIVTSEDEYVFSLWYEGYVKQPEADVVVVAIDLLQFDWYWDDLHRHAPLRVPSYAPVDLLERLMTIVGHNIESVPVYSATKLHALEAGFDFVPTGPIFRLEPHG